MLRVVREGMLDGMLWVGGEMFLMPDGCMEDERRHTGELIAREYLIVRVSGNNSQLKKLIHSISHIAVAVKIT